MPSFQSRLANRQHSPVNMLESIQKHFGCGQLWPSRIGLDCIYTRSDFLHPVQFCSPKEGPEGSWCARMIGPSSGRMQPVCYQFPTYTRLCSATIGPDHIMQNLPGSNLGLADCVWFGQNKSSLEARQCASLGPLLDRAGLDPACLLGARQSASSLHFGLPASAGTISVTPVVMATSTLVLISVNDMAKGFLPVTQHVHSQRAFSRWC